MSVREREESRSLAGTARPAPPLAARWRSMAISGTTPEPPATSSSGPPAATDQAK
jgi:hypothetical protein